MHIESIGLGSISTKTDYGLTASATERDTGSKFLRITDIREGSIDWENVPYCQCSQKDRKKYELKQGDIVFARTGSVGNSCLIREAPPGAVFASYLIRIRPNRESVDPLYLSYFFLTPDYWQQIMRAAVGAIHLGLNATKLKQLQVPLPPLPEQQRIAAVLARADRLRRLRRYALELGDGYLQSVFLQMFGDPVTNPMGWNRAKVSQLGKVQTGNTPSRGEPDNYGDHIEWIKSDNIVPGQMLVYESLEMLSKKGLEKGRSVEAGSILVTCIAGSPTSIGNVALTDRRVSFNQQINAVTPHKDVDSLFLYGLFVVAKPFVQRNTTLAMKRMISKSKFEGLVLVRPPLPLQQQFARIAHQFERLRAQQREAQRQAEHLFQTLLHRAFQGEV
jgi:type I restriction enzyme S subunit